MPVEISQPIELILRVSSYTPASTLPTGLIFVSGGNLCYVSGANIVMFNSGISGAALLS